MVGMGRTGPHDGREPATRVDVYADVAPDLRALFAPVVRALARARLAADRYLLRAGRSEEEVVVGICVPGRPPLPVYLSRDRAGDAFSLLTTAVQTLAGTRRP